MFDPVARRGPPISRNRFTALRRFEIDTCNGRMADCSQDDSYQRAYLSPADAFPADVPRPVAPMLLMREFSFSPVQATHAADRRPLEPVHRRPGVSGRAGRRPDNATDCNEAGPAATRFVRVAELQAFSQPSTVSASNG